MGSLYIHIPFCKQACRYCDFYFTVSSQYQDQFTDALIKELEIRPPEFTGRHLSSLYFGGGTPSVLSLTNLERILKHVQKQYMINADTEMTLEANPDDLSVDRLTRLKKMGWNRISIGTQSFREEELKLMRRSHDASQARASIEAARKSGFDNISLDLIYGIPGQTEHSWVSNLEQALGLRVDHLSAYHLSFEEGTVFDHWRKKGRIVPVEDEESVLFYGILRDKMRDAGFEHYEISNFAMEGKRSAHNQVYWSGRPYLGFGPSAHSFDGERRSWNVASLKKYILCLSKGQLPSKFEELSIKEQYHDYLITSLRTSSGADPAVIEHSFGCEFRSHFDEKAEQFNMEASMHLKDGRWIIDPEHWLRADFILRELFLI